MSSSIKDDDHRLMNRYLQALGEMITWAQREGGPAIQTRVRAFALRDELKKRVRKVLQES